MSTETLKTKIEIYDPPMCCPGGMCGPVIDQALLDFNEAIIKIKKEFNDTVSIDRYLLTQQGQNFMQHTGVVSLLKTNGTDILPITTVKGEIVKSKEFPSYEELKSFIENSSNGK
jgi:hypothetical protein